MWKIFFLFFLFSTRAFSAEMVKEVNFDLGENYENCGLASAKYIFYADSRYELLWFCPEQTDPQIYKGNWKNLSENTNDFSNVKTEYVYDGVEYTDIVRINDNSIGISWNGGEEITYRFTVRKISNENPKDLTGNFLSCAGTNIIHDETLAIEFLSENTVKYAYVKYGLDANDPYIIILNKGEKLKYEVNEKYVVIKTQPMIDHTWGNGDKEKGFTLIDREDLTINRNLLGENHKHWKGLDIYPYPTKPQCYLIDAEKEDPFEKFSEINLNDKNEKEKKL